MCMNCALLNIIKILYLNIREIVVWLPWKITNMWVCLTIRYPQNPWLIAPSQHQWLTVGWSHPGSKWQTHYCWSSAGTWYDWHAEKITGTCMLLAISSSSSPCQNYCQVGSSSNSLFLNGARLKSLVCCIHCPFVLCCAFASTLQGWRHYWPTTRQHWLPKLSYSANHREFCLSPKRWWFAQLLKWGLSENRVPPTIHHNSPQNSHNLGVSWGYIRDFQKHPFYIIQSLVMTYPTKAYKSMQKHQSITSTFFTTKLLVIQRYPEKSNPQMGCSTSTMINCPWGLKTLGSASHFVSGIKSIYI